MKKMQRTCPFESGIDSMGDLLAVVAMKFWVFAELPLIFFGIGWIS